MTATAQPAGTIDGIPADELLRRVRRLVGATARI